MTRRFDIEGSEEARAFSEERARYTMIKPIVSYRNIRSNSQNERDPASLSIRISFISIRTSNHTGISPSQRSTTCFLVSP